MDKPPADPAAFFREMLGQWEKVANTFGGEAIKSEEFTRAMHGANAASMTAQGAFHQVMERVLAAANLPTKTDFEDLSARVGRIEAALFRIEAKLADGAGSPPAADDPRPRPTRGRKPPKKAQAE